MPRPLRKFKVFIVDGHPLIRDGLRSRISSLPHLVVCGESASEDEAFHAIQRLKPDLVIVDIILKEGTGLELVKRLRTHCPNVRCLVIDGYHESPYAERALRVGALGYLSKHETESLLLEAIEQTLRGERFAGPELSKRLIQTAMCGQHPPTTPLEALSNRELEIFQWIGQGLSTSQIATKLFLSVHTVDTHRENIKRKLALKSASELTRAAVQWVLENQS
ncbi:MAG: response regulator [Pirellula sp.]